VGLTRNSSPGLVEKRRTSKVGGVLEKKEPVFQQYFSCSTGGRQFGGGQKCVGKLGKKNGARIRTG